MLSEAGLCCACGLPTVTKRCLQDGVMDNLYELILETVTIQAHTVGFPELVLPAVIQVFNQRAIACMSERSA